MTGTRSAEILRHLEIAFETDGLLLAQFSRREESAFARIVRRHGPAVLDVCRRITEHEQDAEDAFQAVFLTLAQKAVAIRSPHSLGYWLYGVAVRVSRRARRSAIRRRVREVQVVDVPEPLARASERDPDLGRVLHEELAKLPSHYREAIVICDLHGESRADAARSLGVPEGTVSSRLASGRKNLAARLARRGVAFSAMAIPTVLASDSAIAAVPDSVVSKTCGMILDWRAGALVPVSVFRLIQGGFVMRKMPALGMACLALTAAGAIFAAQQADPPKPDAAQPTTERPAANGDRTDEKSVAGFGPPRLQQAFDIGLSGDFGSKFFWSPDGRRLAIGGFDGKQPAILVFSMTDRATSEPTTEHISISPEPGAELVGFTPDSKQVATELREYDLVSGRHKLAFWEPIKDNPASMKVVRTVKLDSDPTFGIAFARDGKTFRTVAPEEDDDRIKKLQVREVSANTGKTIQTLLQLEGGFDSYQLSSDGSRLVTGHKDSIAIHDIPGGIKKTLPFPPARTKDNPPASSTAAAPIPDPEAPSVVHENRALIAVTISPNGKVAFASRDEGLPLLVNADTGKALPPLQGEGQFSVVQPTPECFSSDARLVAVVGTQTDKKTQVFLKVWDSRTGKLMKSWPRNVSGVAFHPTEPVLAILERTRTGKQLRLGLWDFSAEVAAR